VVSSLAIHNIPDAAGRAKAIAEAVRVLRPGGQLLIADIRAAGEYRDTLRQMGLADVDAPLGMALLVRRPVDGHHARERHQADLMLSPTPVYYMVGGQSDR
jgi:SAM-dependent methyltransferase